MSSVGVTFANRVLGLRLAPALQIDKAKVVPVFYSHSCQNAYSRQHPFAELCANSEHGGGKDAILHDKKVESWRQDPERKNQYTTKTAREAQAEAIGAFMFEMQELDTINEFDEKLWLTIIDTVTVHADGRMTFKFQGGTEIEA